MSRLQECAQLLCDLAVCEAGELSRITCELDAAINAMLIFLDEEDVVEIITQRVLPMQEKRGRTELSEYWKEKVADLRECIFNEEE